ncbi:rhophilin-1-like isoform X2 [Sycon ciliatum]
MICLGLKETDPVDLILPLERFLQRHYHVEPSHYEDALTELASMRQAVRTPKRNEEGLGLLIDYVKQLYFVERRFFRSQKHGIVFQWYDSIQGLPTAQQSITFEKASVIFNVAVLHSQFAAKQDRSTSAGVEKAVEEFEKAAGMFDYLNEKFYNAPSPDMAPDTLQMLSALMLAQAQECLFERRSLDTEVLEGGVELAIELAQETARVADLYEKTHQSMGTSPFKGYITRSWVTLAKAKDFHFRALSRYYTAAAHLDFADETDLTGEEIGSMRDQLHHMLANNIRAEMRPIMSVDDQIDRGVGHLQSSILLHRDALRLLRSDSELKKLDTLIQVFYQDQQMALNKQGELQQQGNIDLSPRFNTAAEAPRIDGIAPRESAPRNVDVFGTSPDSDDFFHTLGPLSLFSSANDWTAPRSADVERTDAGFGFAIRGNAPVLICSVDKGSPAELAHVQKDDVVMAVNGHPTLWSTHGEVVDLVKKSGSLVQLALVSFTRVRRSNVLPPTRGDEQPAPSSSSKKPESNGGSNMSSTMEDAMQY